METTCPACAQALSAANMNVAEGIAVCPRCSAVTRLSSLAVPAELAAVDVRQPPSGCRVERGLRETVVVASARSPGHAATFLLVALFWNGGISIFIYQVIAMTLTLLGVDGPKPMPVNGEQTPSVGFTIFLWCFLTPFVLIGLSLLATAIMSVAGRYEVSVGTEGGAVFAGCGPVGWKRRFDPREVRSVELSLTRWKQNDQSKPVIVIEAKKPLRFGVVLTDERRKWMTVALRTVLPPK